MSRGRVPIAILASGRGSNFDAIQAAVRDGHLPAEIVAVVSDQPGAGVLKKAADAGIPTRVVPLVNATELPDVIERRHRHDQKILQALAEFSPHFLVMAGYMRIVTSTLLEPFRTTEGYTRITNIHPSLLPAFPGVNSYAQAFRYGTTLSGVTVHLVEEKVDNGPICAQESFFIGDCRSEKEVEERGLKLEHRLYPETLKWVLTEKFIVEHREMTTSTGILRRLCVRPN